MAHNLICFLHFLTTYMDNYNMIVYNFSQRSTPVETLHSILLGPYKYLTRMVMARLTREQKIEVAARMRAVSYSGIKGKVHGDITRYYGSFVGRDYKAWAQISIFIITPYLTEEEREVWLSLSQVQKCSNSHLCFSCTHPSDAFHGVQTAGVSNCILQIL